MRITQILYCDDARKYDWDFVSLDPSPIAGVERRHPDSTIVVRFRIRSALKRFLSGLRLAYRLKKRLPAHTDVAIDKATKPQTKKLAKDSGRPGGNLHGAILQGGETRRCEGQLRGCLAIHSATSSAQ